MESSTERITKPWKCGPDFGPEFWCHFKGLSARVPTVRAPALCTLRWPKIRTQIVALVLFPRNGPPLAVLDINEFAAFHSDTLCCQWSTAWRIDRGQIIKANHGLLLPVQVLHIGPRVSSVSANGYSARGATYTQSTTRTTVWSNSMSTSRS
jgi:hypothetical protein